MTRILLPVLTIIFCPLLISCTSFSSTNGHHQSMCAALKQQIIFGGGTSDTRRANIENAEQPLQQHNYDRSNCN